MCTRSMAFPFASTVWQRTIVDCFKYRNKLGLDIAIEALRFARAHKRISNREVLHFARLLRQDRVMAPYLESVT